MIGWKRRNRERSRERSEGGLRLGGVDLGARPWLVLGGGGLRGLAHLGAWRVLSEAGLRPSGILGTSIGALVGACIAGERPLDELEADALALEKSDIAVMQRRVLWLSGVRSPALFRGDVLQRYLGRVLPAGGWEALAIRFQANAVELGSGRMEWFGIGARTDVSLPEAIYASAALPVFYPPLPLPGGVYVDGGTEDSLPIQRAAELGATGIVAVDVGSAEAVNARRVVERGMLAVHERVFSIMSGRRRRRFVSEWSGPPLLYIRPMLDGFATLELRESERVLAAGREAAEAALAAAESEPVR